MKNMKSTHLLIVASLVIGVLVTGVHAGEFAANTSPGYPAKALYPSQHSSSTEQRLFDLDQINQNVPLISSQESLSGAPDIPSTS